MPWRAGRGFVVRDWRSGVSAERRHLKIEREIMRCWQNPVSLPEPCQFSGNYWKKAEILKAEN
jgi:hypothetical protein